MQRWNHVLPQKVCQALKAGNFTLVRQKTHFIFRDPSGYTVTLAKTPRCPHAERNMLRYINAVKGLR